MTTQTKGPIRGEELVDRIELSLQDLLTLERLLWSNIRGEAAVDKINYGELQLMGKLHRSARRLREKINEAGRG